MRKFDRFISLDLASQFTHVFSDTKVIGKDVSKINTKTLNFMLRPLIFYTWNFSIIVYLKQF